MAEYWLDASIFIQPKNGAYAFDIAPGFWAFIYQKVMENRLSSTVLVYEELVTSDDELADWAKARRDLALFIEPDEAVQAAFRQIAGYVVENYAANQASEFLSGADAWIIAHAITHGGKVVTQGLEWVVTRQK